MPKHWLLLNRYRGSGGVSPVHVRSGDIRFIDETNFGSELTLPSGKVPVAEKPERIIELLGDSHA